MPHLVKAGGYTYKITLREDGRYGYDVQGVGWGEAGSHPSQKLAEDAVERCLAKRRMKDAA